MMANILEKIKSLKGEKLLKIVTSGSYSNLDAKKNSNQYICDSDDNFIFIFDNHIGVFVKSKAFGKIEIDFKVLNDEELNDYLSNEYRDLFNDFYKHHDDLGDYLGISVDERDKDYTVTIKTEYVEVESSEYLNDRVNLKLVNGVEFEIYPSDEYEELVCVKVTGCRLRKKMG